MPTTRRHRRRPPLYDLTEPERHLLETGNPSMKPGRYPGWLKPFVLVSPAGRDELRALWSRHRDELLAEWKREGRKGRPWAETEFDETASNHTSRDS